MTSHSRKVQVEQIPGLVDAVRSAVGDLDATTRASCLAVLLDDLAGALADRPSLREAIYEPVAASLADGLLRLQEALRPRA